MYVRSFIEDVEFKVQSAISVLAVYQLNQGVLTGSIVCWCGEWCYPKGIADPVCCIVIVDLGG